MKGIKRKPIVIQKQKLREEHEDNDRHWIFLLSNKMLAAAFIKTLSFLFLLFSCSHAAPNTHETTEARKGTLRPIHQLHTDSFTAMAAQAWPEGGCWWPLESSRRQTQCPHPTYHPPFTLSITSPSTPHFSLPTPSSTLIHRMKRPSDSLSPPHDIESFRP